METLRFTVGNAKLQSHPTMIFNLPAGWSCPAAKLCLSKADRKTGCITDGKHTEVRCFGATCEARSANLRKMVWHNRNLIDAARKDGADAVADLIDRSMPDWNGLVRIHSTGGDFLDAAYLGGWLKVMERRTGKVVEAGGKIGVAGTVFYAYVKNLPLFKGVVLPDNFKVVASAGGKYDKMIPELGLRTAHVVLTEEEAALRGLPIDHDDTHVWGGFDRDFALMVHGTQPKGSKAAAARNANRKEGKFTGYRKEVAV
jgi:hypothetical protein